MRRRTRNTNEESHQFGAAGWLFADLFVALTMAFLVAATVGQVVPQRTAALPPTPTPTMVPTPTVLPGLAVQPITLALHIDYHGLLNHDSTAIATAEQQVRANRLLVGRRAGLVLAFGGALGAPTPNYGTRVAQALDQEVLAALGQQGYVFTGTVYREFFDLGVDPSYITVDVYVFKR